MPKIKQFEVMAVDLPFRRTFRHAAAARNTSDSLFVKCVTDTGAGFGEGLPRDYVTQENSAEAFALLDQVILPRLVGMQFNSMDDVYEFLRRCDGKAPAEWVSGATPQLAAWCAVDLALLDAFGHSFNQPVRLGRPAREVATPYSGVVSAEAGWRYCLSLLKLSLYGIHRVKLKTGGGNIIRSARLARRILGPNAELRVDANMGWDRSEALQNIRELEKLKIHSVEQPLEATDFEGAAALTANTGAEIIADEAFTDRSSLEVLTQRRACRGINLRISKCGGLVAAAQRWDEARRAGLTVQVGCQVGESSLLSAAQRILILGAGQPKYLEGCYGHHLLQEDPVRPCLQLRFGGGAPPLPEGPGLGPTIDEEKLARWVTRHGLVDRVRSSTKERRELCHL